MSVRTNKRNKQAEQHQEQMIRQQIQNEIFKLEYLNNTMNYIIPDKQPHNYFLDINEKLLDTVIHEDLNRIGLDTIERIKAMKQKCDENIYIKDLQQCGDFVNYDHPKEYRINIKSIEAQLREQQSKQVTIKRIRGKYPQAPQHMTSSEMELWSNKLNDELVESYLKNSMMIPEESEDFNINSIVFEDVSKNVERRKDQRPFLIQHQTGEGNNRNKSRVESESKEKKGPEKGKKIAKKIDVKNQHEEYRPKPGKKQKNAKVEQKCVKHEKVSLESIASDKKQSEENPTKNEIKAQNTHGEHNDALKKEVIENEDEEVRNIESNFSSSEPKSKKKSTKKKQTVKKERKRGPRPGHKKKVEAEKKSQEIKNSEMNIEENQQIEKKQTVEVKKKKYSEEIFQEEEEQLVNEHDRNIEILIKNEQKQEIPLDLVEEDRQIKINEAFDEQIFRQEERVEQENENSMRPPLNIPDQQNELSIPNTFVPSINQSGINIEAPSSSNVNDEIDIGDFLNP